MNKLNNTESELKKRVAYKKKRLSKFKQLIADVCEVSDDKKCITPVYLLGKKSDGNSRIRPVLIKFSNRKRRI